MCVNPCFTLVVDQLSLNSPLPLVRNEGNQVSGWLCVLFVLLQMSKSRGNVINPDDIVGDFGADSLRLYEMFMGPLRDTKVGMLLTRCVCWAVLCYVLCAVRHVARSRR